MAEHDERSYIMRDRPMWLISAGPVSKVHRLVVSST